MQRQRKSNKKRLARKKESANKVPVRAISFNILCLNEFGMLTTSITRDGMNQEENDCVFNTVF